MGLFKNYVRNNLKRKIPFEFNLTPKQLLEISKGNCYLCGMEPLQRYWKNSKNQFLLYNGLDRLDNRLGYTVENCRPCCKRCNSIKSEMTLKELKTHLEIMLKGMK